MLAALRDAIRADIEVGSARGEVGRQLRYAALTGALAAVAALAAVGAIVIGLIVGRISAARQLSEVHRPAATRGF